MTTLSLPTPDQMYRALCARDATFEGVFFVGVRTTGIACRPTCRAKKPKRENVEYFASLEQAMLAGFRPCKVCRPLEPLDQTPDWLRPLLEEVESAPSAKLRDADLRSRGLDPVAVRRWFVDRHGMTFHAYTRARRLGSALGQLQAGAQDTLHAGMDAGFDSASGFRDAFTKFFGVPPGKAPSLERAFVDRIETPLGVMVAVATEDALWMLEFGDRRMLETQVERVRKRLGGAPTFVPGSCGVLETTKEQLASYFDGSRTTFDLPLRHDGTPFQESVWKALLEIPSGETRTYAQLADSLGRPTAVRAVGRSNGDNRFAIVIPCHRVVGSGGSLVGYGGKLWRKKWLLAHERAVDPQSSS